MRVLFTNNTLAQRAGTELYVRDVCGALKRRGHQPVCFTLEPGEVSAEINSLGVEVVDDLHSLGAAPDVIHGHHRIETTLAALHFPRVPVLSFCHGPRVWAEAPCRMPNVVGWVAIDDTCRKRLIETDGIDPARIRVIRNFVDLERFPPRPPLPERPARALLFSNDTSAHGFVAAIEPACAKLNVTLEVFGASCGRPCNDPGKLMPEFDVVFGKARVALEAMAAGCAVVLADYFGAGPLVTPANFDECRRLNFGMATMTEKLTSEHIERELARYDAAASTAVSALVRQQAGLEGAVDNLLDLYQWAADQNVPAYDPWIEGGEFLRWHLLLAKQRLRFLRPPTGRTVAQPAGPFAPGELSAVMREFLRNYETPEDHAHRLTGERGEMRARWIKAREEARAAKARQRLLREAFAQRKSWWRRWWHRRSKAGSGSELPAPDAGGPAS